MRVKSAYIIICTIVIVSCAKKSPNVDTFQSVAPLVKSEKIIQLYGASKFGGNGWIAGLNQDLTEIARISPNNTRDTIRSDIGRPELIDINRNGVVIGNLAAATGASSDKLFVYTQENNLKLIDDILLTYNQKAVRIQRITAISNKNLIVGKGGYDTGYVNTNGQPIFTESAFIWNVDTNEIEFRNDRVTRTISGGGSLDWHTLLATDINDSGTLALDCGGIAPCAYAKNGMLIDILSNEPQSPAGSFINLNNTGTFLINGATFNVVNNVTQKHVKNYIWNESEGLSMLPSLNQQACSARKLNDHNIAVGSCWDDTAKKSTAVVWKDGIIYDLNQGLSGQSHHYTGALDIDEQNHILVSIDDGAKLEVYELTLADDFLPPQTAIPNP